MRRKKQHKEEALPKQEEKVLDVNASMQGTLRFDDPVNLRISGKFEGTLDTKGRLMVGKKADISADITGESISIAGNVKGNIKAFGVLSLESTAVLEGDVEAASLSVEEGAVINGNLRMTGSGSSAPSGRGDWMTISQLAKYLEVESAKVTEWADGGMLPGTREGGEWVFEKNKVDQWIADGKVKA
ncbi:MAG: helix-turn-helix domain-containing protein [Candidatus Omnitrophica bacterium]|nr:helix-turn-helix domain-containing protein [Candidatus Omnitrophota bacterium]